MPKKKKSKFKNAFHDNTVASPHGLVEPTEQSAEASGPSIEGHKRVNERARQMQNDGKGEMDRVITPTGAPQPRQVHSSGTVVPSPKGVNKVNDDFERRKNSLTEEFGEVATPHGKHKRRRGG